MRRHFLTSHLLAAVAVLSAVEAAGTTVAPHETCGAPAWRAAAAGRALADSRVAGLDEIYQTRHFEIRYTTDEASPDRIDLKYRDRVASYCETAYEHYRDEFGLAEPRGTGSIGASERPLIRVGVHELGYLGSAYFVAHVGAPCFSSASGGIRLRNTLTDDALRRASSHEVFHLFQYIVDPLAPDWLMESTARWAEWKVWPGAFRFDGVSWFFDTSYAPPWGEAPSTRMYGGMVFWYFLEHVLADERVPALRIWDAKCDGDFETAVANLLRAHGRDLSTILCQFWQWNYRTAALDDGQHYRSGHRIPSIRYQMTHKTYPVEHVTVPGALRAQTGGANFVRFHGKARRSDLRITFDGSPLAAAHRAVTVVATSYPNTHTKNMQYVPDENGDLVAVIEDWHLYDHIVMIVTNHMEAPPSELDYSYSAEETGREVFDAEWSMTLEEFRNRRLWIAPNPFREAAEIRFRTDASAGQMTVFVTDVAGRLVRTLSSGRRSPGDHYVSWNGTDERGRALSAGVYFLTLRNGNRVDSKRISLVR